MNISTFLQEAHFIVATAVTSAVLCFSITAYYRTRMPAFAFWIAGCAMAIILSAGLQGYGYTLRGQAYRRFVEFYYAGFIVQALVFTAGSIMVIRYILSKFGKEDTKDEATRPTSSPESTTGASSSSDVR